MVDVVAGELPKDSPAFWALVNKHVKASEKTAEQFNEQIKFLNSQYRSGIASKCFFSCLFVLVFSSLSITVLSSSDSSHELDSVMLGISHFKQFLGQHATGFESLGDTLHVCAGLRHKLEVIAYCFAICCDHFNWSTNISVFLFG